MLNCLTSFATINVISASSSAVGLKFTVVSARNKGPFLIVDGEMQASVAFNNELMKENYPFCELVDQNVNTLIFPNLAAGNVTYNLLKELGTADAIGPILLGLKKPVHILQLGSSVRSIINMALIAVVDAQKSKVPTEEIVQKSRWWKPHP